MKWQHDLSSLWHRMTALFRRRRRAREIDDELRFHLAMREAEHQGAGRNADAAALAARRQFGNLTSLKEQTNDMWTFPSLESFVQDIRYALRTLRKSPAFSVVAILVLAIGIGANTAMFSLIDAMMLRGLPYANADRLVLLIGNVQRATVERRGNSWPDHQDWRAKATQFDDMAAYGPMTLTLSSDGGEPERLSVETVSAPYFALLGVPAAHGRTFTADEDKTPNGDPYVVLSDGLWKRRFGGDPTVLNRTVRLGTSTFTVLGIMPPGFTGLSDQAQLWIPFTMSGTAFDQRGSRGFQTLARVKSGATIASARAELDAISRQLEQAYPATNAKRGVELSPLTVETFGQLKPVVLTLMAAVTFVLFIACANVANLLIGRSEARQREIAVRTALGAGQGRLVRQLITESCVLTSIGAVAGAALARVAVRALVAASPLTWPSFVQPALNMTVLGFTIGVALICGIALGLAPAMHARFSRLTDALKESARGSGGVRSQRLRASLVVVEVALAIVLLAGAGLMIRSGLKLTAIDPGFDPVGVLTLNVGIPRQPSATPAPQAPAPGSPAPPPPPLVLSGQELIDRLRTVPGVVSVSLASDIPLGPGGSAIFYAAEGDTTTDPQTLPRAYVHRVSPEFFETLKVPMLHGRTFRNDELTQNSTAVIVSENVTRRFWPNQDPIGKRIRQGPANGQAPWLTIIGVVGEMKYRGLPSNPTGDPDLYFPWLARSPQPVVIRAAVDPASLIGSVRASIRQGQPGIVVYGINPMSDLVANQTSTSRMTTWLLGLFATTALVLSVIGIYGVMSYLVTLRTREFGIRLALGARRFELVKVVLKQGARLIAIGGIIGVTGVAALSSLLNGLLFGVTTMDIASGMAILLLIVVAVLACAVPALRATRVDPIMALRSE